MQYFNHHSLSLSVLIAFTAALIILVRARTSWFAYVILGMVSAILLVLWYFIRPIPSMVRDIAEVQALIGGEVPVLLEFQSPY